MTFSYANNIQGSCTFSTISEKLRTLVRNLFTRLHTRKQCSFVSTLEVHIAIGSTWFWKSNFFESCDERLQYLLWKYFIFINICYLLDARLFSKYGLMAGKIGRDWIMVEEHGQEGLWFWNEQCWVNKFLYCLSLFIG